MLKSPICDPPITFPNSVGLGYGQESWRRKWQPSPVFLPGKSHGERSLVGYNLSGHRELDTTATEHTHTNGQEF